MCSGGRYPSVRGQPPHLAWQYALPAPIKATRASCSLRFRMITTLSGSASFSTARKSFPRGHVFQYGFDTTPTPAKPPLTSVTRRYIAGFGKGESSVVRWNQDEAFVKAASEIWQLCRNGGDFRPVDNPIQTQRRRSSPVRAVGPDRGGSPPTRLASGQGQFHYAERAALHRSPFCPLSEAVRQSAKLSRGYVGLVSSLALKPHRSGFILNARDLRPVAKLNEVHGSHLSALKSAPRLEASQ